MKAKFQNLLTIPNYIGFRARNTDDETELQEDINKLVGWAN